ncbi:hypothetical protein Hanom_Chr10g00952721 [Helianthus anomalus]
MAVFEFRCTQNRRWFIKKKGNGFMTCMSVNESSHVCKAINVIYRVVRELVKIGLLKPRIETNLHKIKLKLKLV